jgi:hypothetical protein
LDADGTRPANSPDFLQFQAIVRLMTADHRVASLAARFSAITVQTHRFVIANPEDIGRKLEKISGNRIAWKFSKRSDRGKLELEDRPPFS